MAYLEKKLIKRIEDKMTKLNSHRPLSSDSVQNLRDEFCIEMTYNSNAIEGNTMTLKETFLILTEGLTIKGKNLKEHLEIKNHAEAVDYLFTIIDTKKTTPLSEKLIRDIHQLIVRDNDYAEPGFYRTTDVRITGTDHTPPPGFEIPKKMNELLDSYRKWKKEKLHILEIAGLLHHELVAIHPFIDGNGRTTRLIMNVILMQAGYPLVIILKNDRKKYYRLLQKADKGTPKDFINFIAQASERSLDLYLRALEKSTPETHMAPLSTLAKKTPYSSEYLSLLARRNLLAAHKRGRVWYSNLESVKNYREQRLRKRH